MFKWFKKNNKSDISTLRQKAKKNDVNAQYELSLAYYRGIGVVKDIQKSNYWFKKAYEGGFERAAKSYII